MASTNDNETRRAYGAVRPPSAWDAQRTVFFPGCALRKTSPQLCDIVYRSLVEWGFCQDQSKACCSLPFSYTGQDARFDKAIGALLDQFERKSRYSTIIAACPNCFYALKDAIARFGYEGKLKAVALPAILADSGLRILAEEYGTEAVFAIHDSCPDRQEQVYGRALRTLAENLNVVELDHHGANSMCCGAGREYYGISFDEQVMRAEERMAEAEGIADGVIAGCGTCVYALSCADTPVPAYHYLEMLFGADFGE